MKAQAPPNYYGDLCARAMKDVRALRCAEEVEKDLTRTFPGHRLYTGSRQHEGIDPLRRVLLTYSIRNESVGYCQSMNVLAGWLLLVMRSEEDAFWVLCAIVEKACPRYYTPNMIGCQVDLRVFAEILARECPQLCALLEQQCLSLPVATTRWFLCLFVTVVPSETALRIWDTFFLHGKVILYRAAVAVLKQLEPMIFAGRGDITETIKTLQQKPRTLYKHATLFRYMKRLADIRYSELDKRQDEQSKVVREEMEAVCQRKDIQVLLRATRFDRSDLDRLSRKFSAMKGVERTSVGGAALNFTQFQELIAQTMPAWHQDPEQLGKMFRVFDQDADGLLNFRELLVGLSMLSSADSEEKLGVMFRLHDTDNDGRLAFAGVCALLKSIYVAACRDVSDDSVLTTLANKLYVQLDQPLDSKLTEEQVRDAIHADPALEEVLNVDLFDVAMKPLEDEGRFQTHMDVDDDDDDESELADTDERSERSTSSASSTAPPTPTAPSPAPSPAAGGAAGAPVVVTATEPTTPLAKVSPQLAPVVPQQRPPRLSAATRRKSSKQMADRFSFMFGAQQLSGSASKKVVYQDVSVGASSSSAAATTTTTTTKAAAATTTSTSDESEAAEESGCGVVIADQESDGSVPTTPTRRAPPKRKPPPRPTPTKAGGHSHTKSALQQPLLSEVDTCDDGEEMEAPLALTEEEVSAAATSSAASAAASTATVPKITDELGNKKPELAYEDLEEDTVCCSPLREFFKAIWRKILIACGV